MPPSELFRTEKPGTCDWRDASLEHIERFDGILDVLVTSRSLSRDGGSPLSLLSGATGRLVRRYDADVLGDMKLGRLTALRTPPGSPGVFAVGTAPTQGDGSDIGPKLPAGPR